MNRFVPVLLCAALLAIGACAEDVPVGEPGGMGGTPAQRGPDPALDVLGTTDHPAHQDTLIPGAAEREAQTRPTVTPGTAEPAGPPAGTAGTGY
jgi:hypothetical protein